MPTFTLRDLSAELGEPFEGDGAILIQGVAEITAAKEGDLSFVANPKYVSKIPESRASVLIVPKDLETDFLPVIRAINPYLTFTKALNLFHQDIRQISRGVHPTSQVSPDVRLGVDVTIMPYAIVESGVVIGDRAVIYPGVYLGRGAFIGNDVTLYSHVSVYDGCRIGDRCILHAGCRIGSSLETENAEPPRPVTLAEDVELGANVVVSGSVHAPTEVGEGTKVDNLVQIGCGTTIGPQCIIVAQVTIGEHVTLEERVTIAGQVVISPGVTVGAQSRIGAKSVVTGDVPKNSDYWGAPAQPHLEEKRLKANLARLPKLFDKLRSLEEQLSGKE